MITLILFTLLTSALGIAPSTKFNLSKWSITLPDGTVKSANQLSSGFDSQYFTLNGDTIRFTVPGDGTPTSGSTFPRSELREMPTVGNTDFSSTSSNWIINTANHYMKGTTKVVSCTDPPVILAQIHSKMPSDVPLAKIYWDAGKVYARYRINPTKDSPENEFTWDLPIPAGTSFSFELSVIGSNLRVKVGLDPTTVTGGKLNRGSVTSTVPITNWVNQYCYFKLGNYFLTQNHGSTDKCVVDLSSYSVSHTSLSAAISDTAAGSTSSDGNSTVLLGALIGCCITIVVLIVVIVVLVIQRKREERV